MKQVSTKSEDSASVAEPPPPPAPRRGGRTYEEIEAVNSKQRKVKLAVGTVGLVVSLYVVVTVFQALALFADDIPRLLQGVIAVIAGVGGAALLFYFINMLVEGFPRRFSEGVIPYAFLLPAMLLIGVMLIYPTVQTINFSFADADSEVYVGLQNYIDVFQDPDFQESIFNNILWLIIVPAVTVVIDPTPARHTMR